MIILLPLGLASTGVFAQIKIGTLLPLTGPLNGFAPYHQKAMELAEKQLQQAGLDVKLVHADSHTDPTLAKKAAAQLIKDHDVLAIVGALASGVTVAVAEAVTIPQGVIQISGASTSPLISELPADQGKNWLYRTCPSDALQGIILGRLAQEKGYKTASILYVNNPYGKSLAEKFKTTFAQSGGKVLAMVPHGEKANASYMALLNQAFVGKPEVLGVFSYPEHAAIYLKEASETLKFQNFLFADGIKSKDLLQKVGGAPLKGGIGTALISPKTDASRTYLSLFKTAYGAIPPLPYHENAYDAIAVIGLAAYAAKQQGKTTNASNVRDYLNAVARPPGAIIKPGEFKKAFQLLAQGKAINYEGAANPIDFNETGNVKAAIEIWQYKDGRLKTIGYQWP